MSDESQDLIKGKGFAWSVSLSILVGVGWLVFLVIRLFFYAKEYVWEQNVAIFLMLLLALIGILGGPWTYWALKKQTSIEKEMWKIKGFRWRVWVSIIVAFGVIIFLIYWFWVLAKPYDIYQNLAVFIVSFLVTGGLFAAMWAPWGMSHGSKCQPLLDEKKEE